MSFREKNAAARRDQPARRAARNKNELKSKAAANWLKSRPGERRFRLAASG
jgi:hypothetical protein